MSNNVLIVEDEAIVALELRDNVERLGHNVVDVSDTAEGAVKIALTKHPDLIIMDVRLKGRMDGVEAATLIRKSVDVPVIFLTAYSGDEILSRASIAEPYGYLLKPVEEQQLASAIRVAMYKHHKDTNRREGFRSFSAILRALPNAVVVTDSGLTVRYLNKRAEELLDISTRKAIKRPVRDIIHLGETILDRDGVEAFDEVLSDGRTVLLGEQTLTLGDSAPIPVRIELSPLLDRDGLIIGALVNLLDLRGDTEEMAKRQLEEALSTAEAGPVIREKGDLRSYLEVEIVRLTMDDATATQAPHGFREGQIASCKRILKYMFGDEALENLETILPRTS